MTETGNIVVRIEGMYGDEELSPSNFDVSQLIEVLGYVKELVQPKEKEPMALVSIEEGSVKNILEVSKDIALQFSIVLSSLSSSPSIDGFKPKEVKALKELQEYSIKNNYRIGLYTSECEGAFSITPQTGLIRSDDVLIDVETYIYGKLVDAGGKNKANIHIDTGERVLVINTDKEYIGNIETNPLYKDFCVRVKAKQNLHTGQLEKGTLNLIEIVNYAPVYDEKYIKSKIAESTPLWRGADADSYVRSIREGTYEG